MKKPWIYLSAIQKMLPVHERKKRKKRRQRSRLILNTLCFKSCAWGISSCLWNRFFLVWSQSKHRDLQLKTAPAAVAGRDLGAQGLIWASEPREGKTRHWDLLLREALALPGGSFCLQTQACNFPSPLLSPLSLCLASPAAQRQQSFPGDSQDSWADLQQGGERWAFTAGHGLGSPQIGFIPAS